MSTTPIAAIKTTNEVEPADISGSGTPVGGIDPVTTARFINTCVAIILPIPTARYRPNLSFEFLSIFKVKLSLNGCQV